MTAPSAWKLEEAMATMQSARERMRVETDDDALVAALDAETDVYQLLDAVIRASEEARRLADMSKERLDALKARKQRYEARRDSLRGVAVSVMETLGETKIERPDFTASTVKPREGLIITDETQIPDEYFRTERKLDRAKLTEDVLKHGVVVDGATTGNGPPSIMIRTK